MKKTTKGASWINGLSGDLKFKNKMKNQTEKESKFDEIRYIYKKERFFRNLLIGNDYKYVNMLNVLEALKYK